MKKIYSVVALSMLGFAVATQAFAISTSTDTSVGVTTPAASVSGSASTSASAQGTLGASQTDRAQLQQDKATLKAAVDSFKQNLVKLKGATPEAKRQFAVDTYTKAYTFFSGEHDKFVAALTTSANAGVDISDARTHFDSAAQSLAAANTDIQTLSTVELSTSTNASARATAKKAESELKEARAELRAGAAALRAAIIAHYHLTTPAVSTNSSTSASTQ